MTTKSPLPAEHAPRPQLTTNNVLRPSCTRLDLDLRPCIGDDAELFTELPDTGEVRLVGECFQCGAVRGEKFERFGE